MAVLKMAASEWREEELIGHRVDREAELQEWELEVGWWREKEQCKQDKERAPLKPKQPIAQK
ncbi:hypothetical protein FRB93_009182 [Tulasnella sp. JGI-2019a]|nr:hypothetical protein FRB93_009182 [Tulasnella sp. JGI-2019a]